MLFWIVAVTLATWTDRKLTGSTVKVRSSDARIKGAALTVALHVFL